MSVRSGVPNTKRTCSFVMPGWILASISEEMKFPCWILTLYGVSIFSHFFIPVGFVLSSFSDSDISCCGVSAALRSGIFVPDKVRVVSSSFQAGLVSSLAGAGFDVSMGSASSIRGFLEAQPIANTVADVSSTGVRRYRHKLAVFLCITKLDPNSNLLSRFNKHYMIKQIIIQNQF